MQYALYFSTTVSKFGFFLSDFHESPISNFMQFRPAGAELTYADRRTDITTLTGALHDYSAAPENFS